MTFLSDEAESKQWKNKDFTSVSTDVLDAMLTHEVSGGGVDSYERLGTAVRMSLEKLSAVPAGERVLMLFTDSSPTDEDLERVFCRMRHPSGQRYYLSQRLIRAVNTCFEWWMQMEKQTVRRRRLYLILKMSSKNGI